MLNLESKSFLQEVLEEEKRIFLEERIQTIKTVNTSNDFVDGNVLYKIPINRTSTKSLIDSYINPTKERVINFLGADNFLRKVTDRVLNITVNGTIKECLDIILQYRQAAGNHFYGALIRDIANPGTIINPFHILSAISLLNDEKMLNRKYKVILYFYTDREEADNYYMSEQADMDKVEKNIDAILLSYTNKLSTGIKIIGVGDMDRNGNVNVRYKETKHPDEDPTKNHYIVTHQLLTQGIMAPYYGTSLIDKKSGNNSGGIPLSPMRSVNISSGSRDIVATRRQAYGSVCCGSNSNSTLTGLRTLSHSNLSSPYNSEALMPGFMPYVDKMIEKSIELYAAAGLVEVLPDEVICPFSDEELACLTLRDFLIMNKMKKKKGKLKPAALEDTFNKIQEYKKGLEDGKEQGKQGKQESTSDDSGESSGDTD